MNATQETQALESTTAWISVAELFELYPDMRGADLARWTGIEESTISRLRHNKPDGSKTHRETAVLITDALKAHYGDDAPTMTDIKWPNGISDLGRPPLTGPIAIISTTSAHCRHCFTFPASNGQCLCDI